MHKHSKLGGAALAVTVGITSALLVAAPAEAAKPTRIKGLVATADGVGLAGIVVTTLADPTGTGQWVPVDDAVTGIDGKYNVGKLDDGWYRVRFDDPTGAYATEFHHDATRIESATPVDLTNGGMPTLATAYLDGAAHLLGTVSGSDGNPVAGAEVTAYVVQGAAWTSFRTVVAGPDGAYDVGGLPAGDYTLGFRDPASGVTEYWNDRHTISEADPVTVPSVDRYDVELATPGTPQEPTPEPDPTPTTPDPAPAPTVAATPITTTTATPATTSPAPAALSVVRKPRIRGLVKVGQRLRVTKGTWNAPSLTRKVQWLANGKVITKATKTRLRLTRKLLGKRISVRVVATAAGHTPVTVTTRRTKKVAG
ncbi:carboxypeptidase regulatory-like domain-containing protein [Nocardioides xinjiangensis]|uniref:carboxypeptidase regulatory-like domain-containing protein n=1 Tax=Nocardioides xinjiangensis TaxID=2817376 RepID=UPI001B302AB5|nr:carboxypeptidase regulatory-like domain-containing protein [Nocardioides sp. SYSU D00778]